jgi:hypothetical protein
LQNGLLPLVRSLIRSLSAILLFLADPQVSTAHCAITDGFVLDNDSTNGTTLNGVRLKSGKRKRLKAGDELRVGGRILHVALGKPRTSLLDRADRDSTVRAAPPPKPRRSGKIDKPQEQHRRSSSSGSGSSGGDAQHANGESEDDAAHPNAAAAGSSILQVSDEDAKLTVEQLMDKVSTAASCALPCACHWSRARVCVRLSCVLSAHTASLLTASALHAMSVSRPPQEFAKIVGQEGLKKQIRQFYKKVQLDKIGGQAGHKDDKLLFHMVFSGPPGTGQSRGRLNALWLSHLRNVSSSDMSLAGACALPRCF